MTRLPKPLLFILFFMTINSCGYRPPKGQQKGVLSFGSLLPKTARQLNDDEMEVALRVCYAVKQLKFNYTSSRIGDKFNFRIQTTGCDGNRFTNVDVPTTLREENGLLKFDQDFNANAKLPGPDTHETGAFGKICNAILSGGRPDNIVNEAGLTRLLFTFVRDLPEDLMIVNWGQADQTTYQNEEYKMVRYDTYRVFTSNSGDPNLGLVTEYNEKYDCTAPGNPGTDLHHVRFLGN
jgi:hypothetical protein